MSDKHISRIAIVGVGLMGGSLGLAIKRSLPNVLIVGFDSVEVLSVALDRGAIDEAANTLENAVRGSDLVFLGTPVPVTLDLLKEIGEYAEPGSWISDDGIGKGVCRSTGFHRHAGSRIVRRRASNDRNPKKSACFIPTNYCSRTRPTCCAHDLRIRLMRCVQQTIHSAR